MRPHTPEEEKICDVIIAALPNDKEDALVVLSSIVEACCHSIGESHDNFMKRVREWKEHRQ